MSDKMTVGSLFMYAKANIERNANMDDPMNIRLVAQLDDAIPKFKDLVIPDVIVSVCEHEYIYNPHTNKDWRRKCEKDKLDTN